MLSKTALLERHLLDEINSGKRLPGSRIASRNRLADKYHCSRTTVERAIANLVRSGHLGGRKGSGTFVRPGPYGAAIQEIVVVANNLSWDVHQYPFSDIFFDFPETAPPLRWMEFDYVRDHMDRLFDVPRAVIWLLPLSSQIDMMEYLHSKWIPQLLINRDYGCLDAIITDPESSIREGLSWLMIEAGRDLAFVAHQPSYLRPYQMPRMLAFYELCIKLGARLAPEALLVRDFSAPEDCFEEIGLQLFSRERCPRGVFVLNCDLAPQFIQTAARYHRHVGKDYFLLTLDEEPQLARFRGVAVMRQSFRLFRQEILHWLGHVASRSPERFLARPKTELIVQ